MKSKNKYNLFKGEKANCWNCEKKCRGILSFNTGKDAGNEIFSCIPCATVLGKIKRLKKMKFLEGNLSKQEIKVEDVS